MSVQPLAADNPRIEAALDELRALVGQRYPDATFQVMRAEDDPEIIHLVAQVDVDDTEELVDLVIDRMIELQIDEGLPIFVIPQRTPERIAARHQVL
jgi:hypothetical protein